MNNSPLAAFIMSTFNMLTCAIYSAIPAAIALAVFHEIFGAEFTVKNYIIYFITTLLIISGTPRRPKNAKEVRMTIYQ